MNDVVTKLVNKYHHIVMQYNSFIRLKSVRIVEFGSNEDWDSTYEGDKCPSAIRQSPS